MINVSKQRFKYRHTVPVIDLNNEAFCYWLGFILADGCISKEITGSDRLIVALNNKDRKHLIKLRDWLQSDHPIYHLKKTNACDFRIRSQDLCDMLQEFGITPRKSLTAIPDSRLTNSCHFWRGMVDGDGTIFIDGRDKLFYLGLLGTYDVCRRFWQFCYKIDSSFQDVSVCKSPWKGYSVRSSGRKAKNIAKALYGDCNIYLDRKKKIVEENIHG